MKTTKKQQSEAIERLKVWLQPGDTIFCVLAHRSTSGMRRVIRFYKIASDTWILAGNISEALGYGYNDKLEGVTVNGCGMDMGFHVVYSLSAKLFNGDGYQLKSSWL